MACLKKARYETEDISGSSPTRFQRGFLRPLATATRFMVGMVACMMVGAPVLGDITPTGGVNSAGGDPADDGPVLPTSGDLIIPDSDVVDRSSLERVRRVLDEQIALLEST